MSGVCIYKVKVLAIVKYNIRTVFFKIICHIMMKYNSFLLKFWTHLHKIML